jgi:hypothetical protein
VANKLIQQQMDADSDLKAPVPWRFGCEGLRWEALRVVLDLILILDNSAYHAHKAPFYANFPTWLGMCGSRLPWDL